MPMTQEELFSLPDHEQLEIFYLLEEGELLKLKAEELKERAGSLSAPSIAEKYEFSEQWVRAIRKKMRAVFGTARVGYKGDWDQFKAAIESGSYSRADFES